MRTPSRRYAVPLVLIGFVAGWLTASWVSPPTAVTQQRPARAVATPVDVPMPRIALDAVTAPRTIPSALRNPFTFAGKGASPESRVERGPDVGVDTDRARDVAAVVEPPAAAPPPWRVIGVASSDDGAFTAVLSGGGEVLLLNPGDRLPDGTIVIEVGVAHVVLERDGGSRETLRLP